MVANKELVVLVVLVIMVVEVVVVKVMCILMYVCTCMLPQMTQKRRGSRTFTTASRVCRINKAIKILNC